MIGTPAPSAWPAAGSSGGEAAILLASVRGKLSERSTYAAKGCDVKTLMEAADWVLRSGLPGESSAPRWTVDVVLGARREDVRQLPRPLRAAYASALVRCLLQSGSARQAADSADREAIVLLHRAAGVGPAATQSACYCVLAEAYLAVGRIREAADCARIASDYASTSGDACRFRALGLSAACRAANGEFAAAAELLQAAEQIGATHHWVADKWPIASASIRVAHRRGDVEGVRSALETLDGDDSTDLLERVMAQSGLIWLHAAREDYRAMLVAAQLLTHGVDRHACPPLFLDQASALESRALVQLGDPAAALRAIAALTSPPDHAVCFELERATIHLQLQEPHRALLVTETCVTDCPDHNLRTLPSVLLRRALAYELLGLTDAADAEFSRSSHLAADLGAVSPALGVTMDVVERLYWRLMTNEPEFGRIIAARLPGDDDYPDPRPLTFVPPQLTDREALLARWLTTELTLREIADRMNVSVNTVKTQSRSLYRKLDVSSRAEALGALELAGVLTERPRD